MKAVKVENNKVVAVSHCNTRPTDPNWHVVADNSTLTIGDKWDQTKADAPVVEKSTDGGIKDLFGKQQKLETELAEAQSALDFLTKEFKALKEKRDRLNEELHQVNSVWGQKEYAVNQKSVVVSNLKAQLVQVNSQLNNAIDQESKGAAQSAAEQAYQKAIAAARKKYEADLRKERKEERKDDPVIPTVPKDEEVTPTEGDGQETQTEGTGEDDPDPRKCDTCGNAESQCETCRNYTGKPEDEDHYRNVEG